MKSLTRKIGMMMASVMVVGACLMGCGNGAGAVKETAKETVQETVKKEETIAGKYKAQFNALDIMNDSVSESGIQLKTDIIAEFELDLKEDGTYVFDLDVEAFKDALVAGITADADDIFADLFKSLGVDTSDMDALAKEMNYDNYEEFKEAMLAQITDQLDQEQLGKMENEVHSEGKYEVKDQTVTFTSDDAAVEPLTIKDDGTLSTTYDFDGVEIELNFVKQ